MRFAQEISIFNPFAIERQVIALGTSITQTAREIELRADELYAEKGSVYDLSSRLSIMAGQITSEVTARENGDNVLSNSITQTAEAITAEIRDRRNADNELSNTISATANDLTIEIRDRKGDVRELTNSIEATAGSLTTEITDRTEADSQLSSRIDQSPHTIKLSVSSTKASKTTGPSITLTVKDANGNTLSTDSGTITIDGNVVFTNQLSTAGQTTINGSNITTGIIKDSAGNTQFNLSTGALTIKKGTINLGAISGGYNFSVTDAGALTAKSGKIGSMTIGDGLQYGKTSVDDDRAGLYLGPDGFAVGKRGQYLGFMVAADGTPLANYLAFMNDSGGRSRYGLWCDSNGRIASGGAIWLNQEMAQTNYLQGNNIVDGYQRLNSDRRIKKNIRYLTPAESREFILALRPTEFEFIDSMQEEYEYWKGVRHGFIAQDVLEALGEDAGKRSLVSVQKWDGMYELLYDELTADIVGICQMHDKRIDELEGRINQIEQMHEGDGK